jgi:GntR family transcriptional repressor for pyruvate dehydrogenase complex
MSLQRYPLVDQLADALRTRVRDGEWEIGSKIPSETVLSAELGVGRSTVREAIRQLVGSGMLAARQGAGVFVVSTEEIADWPVVVRKAGIADVIEVRLAIEVEAARLAALRRTDDDLQRLRKAIARRDGISTRDREAFVDADLAFHAAIVEAAGNPVLIALWESFLARLREALLAYMDVFDLGPAPAQTASSLHRAIYDAIWYRDAERAAAVSRDHLTRMHARLAVQS